MSNNILSGNIQWHLQNQKVCKYFLSSPKYSGQQTADKRCSPCFEITAKRLQRLTFLSAVLLTSNRYLCIIYVCNLGSQTLLFYWSTLATVIYGDFHVNCCLPSNMPVQVFSIHLCVSACDGSRRLNNILTSLKWVHPSPHLKSRSAYVPCFNHKLCGREK